jgi:redox-sensitive bicupin YhaK (pirin superfamily)
MGEGSVVPAGDVIAMSAGTGITHSEFNHSKTDPVHFLQIWIVPDRTAVAPRYAQRHFPASEKRGRLRLLLSPDGQNGSLGIYQDARVYAGLFDGAERAELPLGSDRFAYVHVIRGRVSLNGTPLRDGDGVRVRHESTLTFSDGEDAELLVFELRPREVPNA